MTPFEEVVDLLPKGLQREVLSMPGVVCRTAEEVRLRVGLPVNIVVAGGREHPCTNMSMVCMKDLYDILERASQHSVHTVLERMRNGFVTVQGGHRIGLCGLGTTERGHGSGFRQLSSLNLRIAKEVKGVAQETVPQLFVHGMLQNTLIIAPPGVGKTTFLRDLIRCVSDGIGVPALRSGVADERGELGALWEGKTQMDLGRHTDVLEGLPKAEAILMLLRGMNPQVIAVDEITESADVNAVLQAAGCGVTLLATAHGNSIEDMRLRPIYRALFRQNIFRRVVLIHCDEVGARTVRVEEIPWFES